MHIYQIENNFGLNNLRASERDEKPVGPKEVRLEIEAVSLNFRDLLMVKGLYNPRQPLPLIPCSDAGGTISEIGSEVQNWKVGDAIMPSFFANYEDGLPTKQKLSQTLGGPLDGTLRESMVLPERCLIRQPRGWTHAESSTIPCAMLTAWSALHSGDKLESVLVQGTGGVSIAALQLAKSLGAKVIATSSSDEKLERLKELGADEVINYKTQKNWGKEVKSLTNGVGVDVVVEVGGAGTLEQSLTAVCVGGCIAMIGVLSGVQSEINLIPILMRQVRVQGIIVGHKKSMLELVAHLETTDIRPIISDRFSFEDTVDAFRHMEAAKHFGKIVIEA